MNYLSFLYFLGFNTDPLEIILNMIIFYHLLRLINVTGLKLFAYTLADFTSLTENYRLKNLVQYEIDTLLKFPPKLFVPKYSARLIGCDK